MSLPSGSALYCGLIADPQIHLKGVMSRLSEDAFSKLCFLFLMGGNSAFIAVIASGLFPKINISYSNNYGPNAPNRKKWDRITKT